MVLLVRRDTSVLEDICSDAKGFIPKVETCQTRRERTQNKGGCVRSRQRARAGRADPVFSGRGERRGRGGVVIPGSEPALLATLQ